MFKNKKSNKGFTLIEILIVIGIIAVLATIVIIAINPARQFAQARDTQRTSNVNTILNAIGQKMADCKGVFNASPTECPTSATQCSTLPLAHATDQEIRSILSDNSPTDADSIGLKCLVPTYLTTLPTDPNGSTSPDTEYDLIIESQANGGRISICTDSTNTESAIPRSGKICVTR